MIKILKPGMMSSIQDVGRYGYRHLGVPISGWMDEISAKKAHMLIQNDENDALLEIGPLGPELLFLEETTICITGADRRCLLNAQQVSMYRPIQISPGDVLIIGSAINGIWSYLSIKGGITTPKILGSRSDYLKSGIGYPLVKGSNIPYRPSQNECLSLTNSKLSYQNEKSVIKVSKGPEWDSLSKKQQNILLNTSYTIGSKSDRMAYYLNHDDAPSLSLKKGIITSAVSPGTIQLPPSGIPMILMKDAQTTGGYARVLQVTQGDLSAVAQKRGGEEVRIELETVPLGKLTVESI